MQYVALYGHLRPVPLYKIFPHYLINGMILDKTVIENKLCVLIFSTNLSETILILRVTERNMIKIYTRLHVK